MERVPGGTTVPRGREARRPVHNPAPPPRPRRRQRHWQRRRGRPSRRRRPAGCARGPKSSMEAAPAGGASAPAPW
jgi:hypothetical protein